MTASASRLRALALVTLAAASTLPGAPSRAQSPDAGSPMPPRLLPPRLIDAPPVELAPDTAPLPDDASVELELAIDATGAVTSATVTDPLRDDVDAAVLEAAPRMRFEPARRDGEPIPSVIRFRYRVQLAAPEPVGPPPAEGAGAADPEATEAAAPRAAPPAATPLEDARGFGATARVRRPEPGAATRITLEGAELTTVPGTFGEPLRVVATLPGVSRTPFNLGYFIVRGASFENTGFFVDGFPVPILYHLGAGPAVLSSRLVTSMDFYPGGYPTRYGRFTAGVIALETGAPEHDGVRVEAEVDLFRASLLAIVPFDGDRGVLTGAFRRSYFDLIIPLIVDGLHLEYTDWQARLDYRLTDRLSMSLFWFGSDDQLDQREAAGAGISDEETQTSLGYRFQRLVGKLRLDLPDRVRLEWAGTVGLDGSSLQRREPGGLDVGADIDGVFLGQRVEAVVPLGEELVTTGGVDVSTMLFDAATSFPVPPGYGEYPKPTIDPQTTSVTVKPIVMTAAPYLEQVWRPGPFEFAAGLRLEYMRYARYSGARFDPRGVVRYQLVPDVTLKLASGLFTQPPQPFQIDHRFGNPELEPSRSWQSSGGVEATLPHRIELESQLFYTRMWNMGRTSNELVPGEDGGLRRQVYVADGEGRAYGWELLLRRRIEEGLFGWLSYTLAWSERFTQDGETVPFFFDQRHMLNLAASYSISGWRFGARFTLASGRPDRPVLGAEEDVDAYRFDAIRGGLVSRLPTYHQLDVRIDRDFTLGPHFSGSIYLDVMNVYNAKNQEGRIWQYDFERSLVLPGLPILPTLGVRLVYE